MQDLHSKSSINSSTLTHSFYANTNFKHFIDLALSAHTKMELGNGNIHMIWTEEELRRKIFLSTSFQFIDWYFFNEIHTNHAIVKYNYSKWSSFLCRQTFGWITPCIQKVELGVLLKFSGIMSRKSTMKLLRMIEWGGQSNARTNGLRWIWTFGNSIACGALLAISTVVAKLKMNWLKKL